MNLSINIHLFAAWCGLVGSGYHLSDQEDQQIGELYGEVKDIAFPRSVLAYFSQARTDTVAVNPYYPRGSDLSCACFFLNRPVEELRRFLTACGSPDAGDAAFEGWIAKLPEVLAKIENQEAFQQLFEQYRSLLKRRCGGVGGQIERLIRRTGEVGFSADVSVVFAPNLLQSKFLADYALVDRTFYVIASVFSENAVLHEYLHLCLRGCRGTLREILNEYGIEAFVNVERMKKSGYMRDDSENSRLYALEDCFIRALVNILCESISKTQYDQWNREQGFTAATAMAEGLLASERESRGADGALRRMARFVNSQKVRENRESGGFSAAY